MPEEFRINKWLLFGLAFVGGYGDAAGLILANAFTGHLTGAFVLTAISVASHDWPTFAHRFSAILLFLSGILLSVVLGKILAKRLSGSILSVVMGIEILLISIAYWALSSQGSLGLELFLACLSLALGLQNGTVRRSGGLSVHTTYLTGMITDLFTTPAKGSPPPPTLPEAGPESKVRLLGGIWLSFVLGALIGAGLVLRFQALGIFGAAAILFGLIIYRLTQTRPSS